MLNRAVLPEIMLLADIANALGLSLRQAAFAVEHGQCGPYVRLANRILIRREAFLKSLSARETVVDGEPHPEDATTSLKQEGGE